MKNAEGDEVLIPEGKSKVWNYHPNLPVPNSPVFRFPTRILFVLNWFRRGWLGLNADSMGDVGFCDLQLVSALTRALEYLCHRGDVLTQSCPNYDRRWWVASVALGHAPAR